MNSRNLNNLDHKLYSKNFDLCNIYVSNIPEEVDIKGLKLKFSRFGTIVNIRMNQMYEQGSTQNSPPKRKSEKLPNTASAFIQFAQSESALEAIKCKKIDGILIAESYWQPLCNAPDFDKKFLLEQLNDDCLLHLYSYLQFEDHINLTKISKHQKCLIQLHYKVNKTFDENNINLNHTTLCAINNFFLQNGKSIENLVLLKSEPHRFRRRIVHFALKYCPNVKTVKIDTYFLKSDFESIMNTFLGLKTLHLDGSIRSEINASQIFNKERAYLNLKHLTILNVRISESVINQFPKYLQNLETLRICFYDGDSMKQFGAAVKGMPKLKKLGVALLPTEPTVLRDYLDLLPKKHLIKILEILEINCLLRRINQLKLFVNLKELIITFSHNIYETIKFWKTLNRLLECNLEKLYIQYSNISNCIDITKHICLKLIRILYDNNLPKLFTLIAYLDGEVHNITLNKYGVVASTNDSFLTNELKYL